YRAPRDEMGKKLVDIWSKVLALEKEKIGSEDGFFTLGGHSLNGTMVVSGIYKEFGVKITLSQLFEMQVIRKLSRFVKESSQDLYIPIKKIEEKEYYLLSSAQKRLYIMNQVEFDSKTYNMPMVFEIDCKTDKKRLEDAFRRLIARHDSFRTSFHMIDGEPVQRIHDPEDIEFNIEYFKAGSRVGVQDSVPEPTPPSGHHRASPKEGISEGRGEPPMHPEIDRFIRPFDLSKAPLIRAKVVNLAEGRGLFLIDIHHIISDGISLDIFNEELLDIYEAKVLPALRIQYKDYAPWRDRQGKKGKLKRRQDYWLNVFAGEIPVLNLATDNPRPQVQSFAGSNISFEIHGEVAAALKTLAQEENVTLFMVLAALVNILLGKLSGQDDIVLGTPAEGRSHPDTANIIGMFVNTLPLRNFPTGSKTFKEFLQEIKHNTLDAYENQDYPFEDLVELVNVSRDAGRNPLFDVMFVLQNIAARQKETRELELSPYKYNDNIAKFDISLFAEDREEGLSFCMQYCTKLFKQETVNRYINYFRKIVTTVGEIYDIQISDLEIIGEEEKKEILFDFNNREEAYPNDKAIPQLFEEQVVKTPHGIAVVSQNVTLGEKCRCLTYSQLDSEAHRLAGVLIGKGMGAGDIAGIIVERSLEMIVTIIAVLKTGAAYLPLNPHSPEDRNRYMLNDSRAKLCLTTTTIFKGFDRLTGCKSEWVFIDEPGIKSVEGAYMQPDTAGARGAVPEKEDKDVGAGLPLQISSLNSRTCELAYVIYTSGSTGQPKGVLINH
ncbi:MAG: AMP-binding protein, partial [Candidatus Aminicenantes bacterium]|nr:AMP-binding protein [Candidatus Aminicenantes bacterium]